MERFLLEIRCDECKRVETVQMGLYSQTFLKWRDYKNGNQKLNFCSDKCERSYLEKRLGIPLRATY